MGLLTRLLVATVWPLVLVAFPFPLSVRRCQRLTKPLAWTPASGPGEVVF